MKFWCYFTIVFLYRIVKAAKEVVKVGKVLKLVTAQNIIHLYFASVNNVQSSCSPELIRFHSHTINEIVEHSISSMHHVNLPKMLINPINSHLWLIYIATLELYDIHTASPVGCHSCRSSLADNIMEDLIDSMCYQRTMASVIEIYSYFNIHKLVWGNVCLRHDYSLSWQSDDLRVFRSNLGYTIVFTL